MDEYAIVSILDKRQPLPSSLPHSETKDDAGDTVSHLRRLVDLPHLKILVSQSLSLESESHSTRSQ